MPKGVKQYSVRWAYSLTGPVSHAHSPDLIGFQSMLTELLNEHHILFVWVEVIHHRWRVEQCIAKYSGRPVNSQRWFS